MQKRPLMVSGVIFLAVALAHAVRYLLKTPVTVGQTAIPVELSFVGAAVAFLLALWMFKSAAK
ncbi:MAG TPA: hypothetical protein PLL75_00895 [Candidatus Omnitrophota bacterium]|nr:hypothetical protein [Candidatus Omnitrophota bacterium]HPS36271.1 hypothetical protein [Candidatus Omnitrophota bacterium]